MKAGRTIEAMLQELARQNAAKEDYLVNTSFLIMEADGSGAALHMAGREEVRSSPMGIRSTAYQQIGAYLGIPAKYYGKILAEDTDLLAYNVNRWFQRNPEQQILRTINGHARAFLSNCYRRIENLDIAKFTLPSLAELDGTCIESCKVTDDRMYIKVVNPQNLLRSKAVL